jgi:hypothetical protein
VAYITERVGIRTGIESEQSTRCGWCGLVNIAHFLGIGGGPPSGGRWPRSVVQVEVRERAAFADLGQVSRRATPYELLRESPVSWRPYCLGTLSAELILDCLFHQGGTIEDTQPIRTVRARPRALRAALTRQKLPSDSFLECGVGHRVRLHSAFHRHRRGPTGRGRRPGGLSPLWPCDLGAHSWYLLHSPWGWSS